MMTAAEYAKHKTIFKKGHKNPVSEDIHTLLVAYEAAQTPNRKIKLLVLLYFLCLEYYWGKYGVKGKEPSARKVRKSQPLVLKDQIEAEIQTVSFQQQYQNKLAGESYKGGVQRAAAGGGGTQLKGAYGVEAIAPQKNLVENYALNTRIPAFGMSLLTSTIESDFQVNHGMGMAQSERAAHLKIANMSLPELFQSLHNLWHDANVGGMEFSFLDTAQRQTYMATCAGGVWSCNGNTPFSTGAYPMMYVMDMSHRLFIPDGVRTGGGNFNHSSILAGKPVVCAGTLTINGAGKLTYIDNDSGHYKPDTAALQNAVRILFEEFQIPAFGLSVRDKVTGVTKSALTFVRQ